MPDTLDLNTAVFSKTPVGQQEIQSRGLGLSPLLRRILVLVDGKRSGQELAGFVSGGESIQPILQTLLEQGCVQAQAGSKTNTVSAAAVPLAPATPAVPVFPLLGLPPAEIRTAKDNEMARNFMINSINAIIGQNMRISLVHDIFHAATTEQLRTVYHAWSASMAEHSVGAKRLPELREKLFKVL
jgi:hypothetical protein